MGLGLVVMEDGAPAGVAVCMWVVTCMGCHTPVSHARGVGRARVWALILGRSEPRHAPAASAKGSARGHPVSPAGTAPCMP